MQREIADILLEIGAVGFSPEKPITFKSGIRSPVYVDNRTIPFYPAHWQTVIDGFRQHIAAIEPQPEIVAGIEAAGIPHSAAIGYSTPLPSVFVRKQPKDHGTGNRIEGGTVTARQIVLVEDLVTTGGSSLSGVEALREAGARVNHCIAIVSYGFKEAQQAFSAARVQLSTLTTFPVILERAQERGVFGSTEAAVITDWFEDPRGWASRHGF